MSCIRIINPVYHRLGSTLAKHFDMPSYRADLKAGSLHWSRSPDQTGYFLPSGNAVVSVSLFPDSIGDGPYLGSLSVGLLVPFVSPGNDAVARQSAVLMALDSEVRKEIPVPGLTVYGVPFFHSEKGTDQLDRADLFLSIMFLRFTYQPVSNVLPFRMPVPTK